MKKIYTKSVFEFNNKTGQYELNHDESEFHFVADDYPIVQMKGGDKGGTNVTVQKSDPWAPAQPYIKRGLNEAENAFLNDFYSGKPQVTPFSQDTQSGFGLARKLATEGSPLDASATGAIDKTLRGDYLYGGEGFNKAIEAAKHNILPGIDSQFEKFGRTGSGLASTARTSAISDAFAKQYGQERENQMRAAQLAPTIRGMRYADADVLSKIGGQQEAKSQEQLDARKNAVRDYLASISGSGSAGGRTTTSGTNPGLTGLSRYLAGGLGGGLAGGLYGGPWGALAGGGLGLLSAFL